jgi:hypothetical protein
MAQPLAPKEQPGLTDRENLPEKHHQHAYPQEQILDDDGHIVKQHADPDHPQISPSISAVSRRTRVRNGLHDA